MIRPSTVLEVGNFISRLHALIFVKKNRISIEAPLSCRSLLILIIDLKTTLEIWEISNNNDRQSLWISIATRFIRSTRARARETAQHHRKASLSLGSSSVIDRISNKKFKSWVCAARENYNSCTYLKIIITIFYSVFLTINVLLIFSFSFVLLLHCAARATLSREKRDRLMRKTVLAAKTRTRLTSTNFNRVYLI